MRRLTISFATAIAMLAVMVGTALGAIVFHPASGPTVDFSSPANGATATFNISGLGNELATANLDIEGSAETFCHNSGKNAKIVPGQNPALAAGSSGPYTFSDSDKNGRDDVVIAAALVTPVVTARQAGCPNSRWTVTVGPLTVDSATLTITYDGDEIYCRIFYPDGTDVACL